MTSLGKVVQSHCEDETSTLWFQDVNRQNLNGSCVASSGSRGKCNAVLKDILHAFGLVIQLLKPCPKILKASQWVRNTLTSSARWRWITVRSALHFVVTQRALQSRDGGSTNLTTTHLQPACL
ncbi:unnamed protein product [Effrenium voratum]|nr:unnamed protein product [Effrenium voratum]